MKVVERNVCWRFVWNVFSFRIVIVTWKWRKKKSLLEFGYLKVVKKGLLGMQRHVKEVDKQKFD